MSYQGLAPTPPRVVELWPLVIARIATPTMEAILGGEGRLFLVTDDGAGEPQGAEQEAWGRGVIAPVRRAFGEPAANAGRDRMVSWLVRFDVHPPGGSTGYNPAVALEAAHAEAFARLHGWKPGAMTYASATERAWRHTDPQAWPLWDAQNGVWFTSAEYRVWLSPA